LAKFGFDEFFSSQPVTEADYSRLRSQDRTYFSRSFPIRPPSRDAGSPGRFVYKVFDEPSTSDAGVDEEWSEYIVVDGARRQVKLLVARTQGQVKEIKIQRVPSQGDTEDLLVLDRTQSAKLVELIRLIGDVPPTGEVPTRIDDDLISALLSDPEGIRRAYAIDPQQFKDLISSDVSSGDVIALAHRREQVARFKALLNDAAYFAGEQESSAGPEGVWQKFLEENPWVLGIGLTGQLLTSWNSDKLEQTVAGFSIAGAGKRADALLRTVGAFRLMVFAEIKHHQTPLVREYRSGVWSPSADVSGGVTQVQQTVGRAVAELGERIADTDEEGAELNSMTFLIRPRSYLIVGDLRQLGNNAGGVNIAKLRSFETYRRNLYEPEIVTFDELLARAQWTLELAEQEVRSGL
jgi:hypothetical protein